MATNPDDIRLTTQQRKLIAEVADQTARPWTVVLQDAIDRCTLALSASKSSEAGRTLYDAFDDKGLIGCVRSGSDQPRKDSNMLEGFGNDVWPDDCD